MTVYVSPLFELDAVAFEARGKGPLCHMIGDTDGELIALARRIGLRSDDAHQFDHPNQFYHHYLLTPTRRRFAVNNGAVEITHLDHIDKIFHHRKAKP